MAASPRFSSSAKALWVVLGVLAVGFAAAVLVDELWERPPTERERVAAYIEEVNAAQRGFIVPLDRVNRTYASLQVGPGAPAQLDELQEAEKVIRAIRVRVADVAPPPRAEELHRELLATLDLQVAFAHEVTELARFLPLLATEDAARTRATVRLQRDLRQATTPEAQGAAFGRYGEALAAHAERLEQLDAPPTWEEALRAEVERTQRLRALNGRVRRALAAGDAAAVERLFAQLGEVVRAGPTPERHAAVRTLERRSRELERKRLAVDRERAQLNASLG